MEIDYSQFVEKYYQMDPKHEDVLFDGTELEDGMVVLVESADLRVDIPGDGFLSGDELEKALRRNRYCKVSHLTRVSYNGAPQVAFIAIYNDGSKKKVIFSETQSWLLIKESVPARYGMFVVSREDLGMDNDDKIDPLGTESAEFDGLPSMNLREPDDKVVGTARVKPPAAWSTPPMGGGDGDLGDVRITASLPKRQAGMLFDDLHKEWQDGHTNSPE